MQAKPGGEDDVTAGGGIAETDALAGTGLNLMQETEALMTTQAGKTVRHLKDVIPAFKVSNTEGYHGCVYVPSPMRIQEKHSACCCGQQRRACIHTAPRTRVILTCVICG